MHYHVELIMPPTPLIEIKSRISEMLYLLSNRAAEIAGTTAPLYDWYQIGGRFASTKMRLRLDPERLRKFKKELTGKKIMVGPNLAGKPQLWPADLIPSSLFIVSATRAVVRSPRSRVRISLPA